MKPVQVESMKDVTKTICVPSTKIVKVKTRVPYTKMVKVPKCVTVDKIVTKYKTVPYQQDYTEPMSRGSGDIAQNVCNRKLSCHGAGMAANGYYGDIYHSSVATKKSCKIHQ